MLPGELPRNLGSPSILAEVFPGDKSEAVQRLQREGYKVAVVGDGVNDSPMLAYADVGIAVEGGTEAARETAPVVLLHGGLWKVPLAIDIGRETVALIRQNWKIISIPNTFAARSGLYRLARTNRSHVAQQRVGDYRDAQRPASDHGPAADQGRFSRRGKAQNSCLHLWLRRSPSRDDEVVRMARDDLSASDVPLEGVNNPFVRALEVERTGLYRCNSTDPWRPPTSSIRFRGVSGCVCRLSKPIRIWSADYNHCCRCKPASLKSTVAPGCQSVTVVHDPAMWTSKSLCLFLQSRSREELEQCASCALPDAATSSFAMTWLQPWRYLNTTESSPGSKGALQTAGPVKQGYWMVGYASMVVGVAMFAVPGVPGIPFLILSTYCFPRPPS